MPRPLPIISYARINLRNSNWSSWRIEQILMGALSFPCTSSLCLGCRRTARARWAHSSFRTTRWFGTSWKALHVPNVFRYTRRTSVVRFVTSQSSRPPEWPTAKLAFEWHLTRVHPLVDPQIVQSRIELSANIARERWGGRFAAPALSWFMTRLMVSCRTPWRRTSMWAFSPCACSLSGWTPRHLGFCECN